jgi:phosphatidate cytidylyltransferase
MKNRIITAVAIAAVGLLLAVFWGYIVFPIAMAVLAVVALFEILRVMGCHKKWAISLPAFLVTAAFPILAFFAKGERVIYFLLALAACLFVYMMWLMGVSVFSKGKLGFMRISEAFVAVTYVTVSFTSLSLLRYLDENCGVFFLVLVFVTSWICDVFAYFTGSLIGRHKLIPEVSPKKTVEGAIGGVVFSVIACLVYGLLLDLLFGNMEVNYLLLALFGLVLSVVSQLGDLAASLIKREYGAKDYGTVFPGHGGVMDRFDSPIAVSTIMLILTLIFPPFRLV